MSLTTLQQYSEIKTPHNNPETTRRPSLALLDGTNTLFMAYTGEHKEYSGIWPVSGRRVWWVQSSSLGSVGSWQQNEPVNLPGAGYLSTQDDVAMVTYQGLPGIVVNWPTRIGVAWFDGNQWTADDTAPVQRKAPGAPVAVVTNGVLHIFFLLNGLLTHLMRSAAPLDIDPNNWTQQTTDLPVTPLSATVADDGTILVLCSPRTDRYSDLLNYLVADPPDDPTNWSTRMAEIEPPNGAALPTNDAAIATDILGTVNLVYRAHGKGTHLYFAGTDPTVTTTLQDLETIPAQPLKLMPAFDVQYDPPSGKVQTAKTQSPPCLYRGGANFAFLAHQGSSSNGIWFGVYALKSLR
jgi:hypothetical protein